MTSRKFGAIAGGTALAACLGLVAAATATKPALAGPCEADITKLERALNNPTGKGTGTLSGTAPGAIQNDPPMPQQSETGPTGKEKGTLAGNSPEDQEGAVDPTGGLATSPQDVRLQQAGMPTVAQGGDPKALDESKGQAQAALDKARDLDARGDAGCRTAVDEAQQLIRKGT